jgi:AraC-like DNA-binding protein
MPPSERSVRRPLVILDSPSLRRLDAPAEYDARRVDGWDALHATLAGAHPATLALVDPYLEHAGDGPPARLRELLERHPVIPVVAALTLRNEEPEHVATMLDWGVAEVLDLELEPNPRALHARLRLAHARPFKRRLEDALSQWVSAQALLILRAAADLAVDAGAAGDLARRLDMGARTLASACAREGLPAPRRLQAWMRVLLGAALLEEPGRSVVNAARGSGYANDTALRRALREMAGPVANARDHTFAAAVQRFNDELREQRERTRLRRRAARLRNAPKDDDDDP